MPLSPRKELESPAELRGINEFNAAFPDDDSCLEFLWRVLYSEDGEHAECPRCDSLQRFRRYAMRSQRRSWTCTRCGYHLHPTVGTIFERSGTPLRAWYYVIFRVARRDERLTARAIQREVGVTYKTAWRMLHLVRNYAESGSIASIFERRTA